VVVALLAERLTLKDVGLAAFPKALEKLHGPLLAVK